LQGAWGNAGAVCRINAAQRRADVREGPAQHPSLDEKRRDGATFDRVLEAVLDHSQVSRPLRLRQRHKSRLRPWVAPFLHCVGAKVLPRGTFGAFVSGYFSNLNLAGIFDDHSVNGWPNALQAASLLARDSHLTKQFSTWLAYCQQETADCSDA